MLGWGGLLRPGEIAKKSKSFRLNRHQIRFEPSGRWDALRDVVLTWRASKMNPHQKLEIIYISCLCKQLFCGMRVICPAHWILATTKMVDARWGNKHPQRPLLKEIQWQGPQLLRFAEIYDLLHQLLQRASASPAQAPIGPRGLYPSYSADRRLR